MNDLLRKALGMKRETPVTVPVFNLGLRAGIDPVALNKLAEDEELLEDARRLTA